MYPRFNGPFQNYYYKGEFNLQFFLQKHSYDSMKTFWWKINYSLNINDKVLKINYLKKHLVNVVVKIIIIIII